MARWSRWLARCDAYGSTFRTEPNILLDGKGTLARYAGWLAEKQRKRRLQEVQEQLRGQVGQLIQAAEQDARAQLIQARATYQGGFQRLLLLAALSLGIALSMDFWLSRTMRQALSAVSGALNRLVEGDLRVQCDYRRNDEFGRVAQDVNRVASNLRDALAQLGRTSAEQGRIAHCNAGSCAEVRQAEMVGEQQALCGRYLT
ncbi:methyl-accepting chemotaxis protein [Pseudomonas benzenivorans]|uniref:Methyl-accepting chemotaxis protein n=1 Tax=Pseudomonas benzenivorans TaxID=556533 RepID=A0ABZ0Q1A5_9PSED|nr:methyl-accepting chemotaxis protein [Pseudomonas benzenivorans]WPC06859.1 methyl-accepting chemotaxis protein [Pseudomonas benzenivorans]